MLELNVAQMAWSPSTQGVLRGDLGRAREVAAEVRRELLGTVQTLQALSWTDSPEAHQTSAAEALPPEFSYDWGGVSYQEKRSAGTSSAASTKQPPARSIW